MKNAFIMSRRTANLVYVSEVTFRYKEASQENTKSL